MRKFLGTLMAFMLILTCMSAFAEETTDVLSEYDITADDLEFVANIFKQVNEGNDPGLTGEDWYEMELKFAKASAALGSGDAALWVGEIYQGGHVDGVDENEAVEIAIEWWNLATENGQPRGLVNIGLLYAHASVPGGGRLFGEVEQDYATALEYYIMGYELGDTKAPRYIALSYHNAEGAEQDYDEAAKFFQIAVDYGDSTANWYLGHYYENGLGVEQDYARAAELYLKIGSGTKSVTGSKEARYALARLYEEGLGVEQDLEEAAYWYQGALDFGHEDAAADLERLAAGE